MQYLVATQLADTLSGEKITELMRRHCLYESDRFKESCKTNHTRYF